MSFNKEDAVQMNLLRLALIRHGSFSGFTKFLLSVAFKEAKVDWEEHPLERYKQRVEEAIEEIEELIQISDKKVTREIKATIILSSDKKIK